MLKNHDAASLLKDSYDMKPERNAIFKETMKLLRIYAYKVRYVPHETIEDYNAAYNVICENKHITTGAAKELGIPLNEIWISEMWRPYEKYILFHELREIYYRAKEIGRDEAHEKAIQDGFVLWKNDPLLQKLIKEIKEMDRKTAEKKKKRHE
jgi:competence protein ComEA